MVMIVSWVLGGGGGGYSSKTHYRITHLVETINIQALKYLKFSHF